MDSEEAGKYWEGNAEAWTKHVRAGYDIYRDALNTPTFLEMLPPIDGLKGLDIGCGEGGNTRRLAGMGALMQAVDIAPTFIRHARANEEAEPSGIVYQVGDGMALPFEDGIFDFATAFMSLMDMPDQARALREAARVMRPEGFLQFSILHPCFDPPHRKVLRDEGGTAYAIEVGGYFDCIDGRLDRWWFSSVPREESEQVPAFCTSRFHRTLGGWVDMICAAGLTIEKLVEPSASVELAEAQPIVADTRVAPQALVVRARKPRLIVSG